MLAYLFNLMPTSYFCHLKYTENDDLDVDMEAYLLKIVQLWDIKCLKQNWEYFEDRRTFERLQWGGLWSVVWLSFYPVKSVASVARFTANNLQFYFYIFYFRIIFANDKNTKWPILELYNYSLIYLLRLKKWNQINHTVIIGFKSNCRKFGNNLSFPSKNHDLQSKNDPILHYNNPAFSIIYQPAAAWYSTLS